MTTATIERLEQSVIGLQTQVAFMEHTLDTLNDIVTQQSQLIADQQRQLQLLYQKIDSQTAASQIQPFDVVADRPPHY